MCPHQAPAEEVRSRRGFVDFVLGLGFLGTLASVIYPVLRYLKPLSAAGGQGSMKLSKEEVGRLEKEHMLILRSGPTRILVFEDGKQQLRALDARCTHEGCTVQYVPGESVVWCACHNGRFDLDGRVLAGPPPRPLARYACSRETDGNVLVSLEKKREEA